MKIAFFDCASGASGDMIIGSLVGAGASLNKIQEIIEKVVPGEVQLKAADVRRGGLAGIKIDVICAQNEVCEHAGGHHNQPHGRRLGGILEMINRSGLPDKVKADASRIFQRLAEAESKAHGCSVDDVHFHEVGAVDAIADVVGAVAGFCLLGVEAAYVSPFALGWGSVESRHGKLPLPAPAALELARNFPCARVNVEGELLTPTGAAILTTLCKPGETPLFKPVAIGYGAGSRELDGQPNLLRMTLGETLAQSPGDAIWVLETNIDDTPAEHLGHVCERLLKAGALDAYMISAQMKKGRPGILLTVIADDSSRGNLERVIFTETTTFGVRRWRCERTKLERETITVTLKQADVRVKLGKLEGQVVTVAPEYEDCRRAAEATGLPLREVYRLAVKAYEARD